MIGIERYPKIVMAWCRHYPKIPLTGGLVMPRLSDGLSLIYDVFSATVEAHTPNFLIISSSLTHISADF